MPYIFLPEYDTASIKRNILPLPTSPLAPSPGKRRGGEYGMG